MSDLRLAVTAGEPGGIGPDLICALAQYPHEARCVIFADMQMLKRRAGQLGQAVEFVEYQPQQQAPLGALEVVPFPLASPERVGHADPSLAPQVLQSIEAAGRACLEGSFDAVVTGPVQKSAFLDTGLAFFGHTEYLAAQAQSTPVMLLLTGDLRIALATTHLPLAAVPSALNQSSLTETLEILIEGLRARFGLSCPHIRVLGLNPHAGEGGHLGREELDIIAPVVASFRGRNCHIEGPVSADTAFVNRTGVDAYLAMYHDQGLPVLKTLGFGEAVNVTLGLPYVRTSVDHGTALALAGSGRADPSSLFAALDSAVEQVHAMRQVKAA